MSIESLCRLKVVAGNAVGAGKTGPAEGYVWEVFAVGVVQGATGVAGYLALGVGSNTFCPLQASIALSIGAATCVVMSGHALIDFPTYFYHSALSNEAAVRIWYREFPQEAKHHRVFDAGA